MQGHRYNAPSVKGGITLFVWHRCRRVRDGELVGGKRNYQNRSVGMEMYIRLSHVLIAFVK
jgi:hypothetical protein